VLVLELLGLQAVVDASDWHGSRGPGSVSPSTPATASTTYLLCCCLYRADHVTEEAACVLIRKPWQLRRYTLALSSHLTGISHVLEMGYTVYMRAARHTRLPSFCRPIQKGSQTCVRAGLAAAAATDGPGKCGAVQTYMINACTCLAKSCVLCIPDLPSGRGSRPLWIRPPQWKGLDLIIGLD
jgi:hypothetical protein